MNDIIRSIEQEQLRADIPDFRPGDTVRVDVKVVEGNKERIQAFEGVVIKRRGSGLSETFTVRRVAYGVAVERCFPILEGKYEFVHADITMLPSTYTSIDPSLQKQMDKLLDALEEDDDVQNVYHNLQQ